MKPTALIGLCTVGGVFTPDILKKMAIMNEHPIIMPLSNPISKSECSFEDAMLNTNGKVIFASGSPFPSLDFNEKTYIPGQGNNMYIFPGLGLAAILSKATTITETMIMTAAEELADSVLPEETKLGLVYPTLGRIREVSKRICMAVIKQAVSEGSGVMPAGNLEDVVAAAMWDPFYGVPHETYSRL